MEAAWVLLLGFVSGAGAVMLGLAVVMRKPPKGDDTQRMVDEVNDAPEFEARPHRDRKLH